MDALPIRDTVLIVQKVASDSLEIYKLLSFVLATVLAIGGVIKMFSSLMLKQSLPAIVDGIKESQDARYVLKTDVGSTAEHKAKNEITKWWSETQRDRIEPLERDVAEMKIEFRHASEFMRKSAEESGAMSKAIVLIDKRVGRILSILRPDEAIE